MVGMGEGGAVRRGSAGPMAAQEWIERHEGRPLPRAAEMDRLRGGDLVALCWSLPGGGAERLWVEILDNDGDRWIGRVDDDPVRLDGPGRDSLIDFERAAVCDLWFVEAVGTSEHERRGEHAPSALVQVAFALEDGSVDTELLWALPLPDGAVRIDSIPFFVAGVGLGDEVVVELDEQGTRWACGVRRTAGAATLRAAVDPDAVDDPAREIVDLAGRLRRSAVDVEVSASTGIVSLAVWPESDMAALFDVLMDLELSGRGLWEECCTPAWWAAVRPGR